MISTRAINTQQTALLGKTKSPHSIQNYEQKLQSAFQMNLKLKDLLQTMRQNTISRKIQQNKLTQKGQSQNLLKQRKKQSKLITQVQQLTNNLNTLINDNSKLKSQVDISRSSRVIYSNVYKNIQKEIRKQEYQYKLIIIDYLCYQEVQKKIQEKFHKIIRKIEKSITQFQVGEKKNLRRKEGRKSRLDTGLSSYRDSKETSRNEQGKATNRQEPNSHTTVQEQPASKIQLSRRPSNLPQNTPPISFLQTHDKKDSSLSSTLKVIHARTNTIKIIDNYQDQLKNTYYDNLLKHLRQITGYQDINDILNEWNSIDSITQQEYIKYLKLQQNFKELRQKKEELSKQFQKKSQKEIETEKSIEEEELERVQNQLREERLRLASLQDQLTRIFDINSRKLCDQEIIQHTERIKRRGENNPRQLEKLLQGEWEPRESRISQEYE